METLLEFAEHVVTEHPNDVLAVVGIVVLVAALWILLMSARIVRRAGDLSHEYDARSGGHINQLIELLREFSVSFRAQMGESTERTNDLLEKLVETSRDQEEAIGDIDIRTITLPQDVVDLIKPELASLEQEMRRSLREAEARIIQKITEIIRGEKSTPKDDPAAGNDDLAAGSVRRDEVEPTGGEVLNTPA